MRLRSRGAVTSGRYSAPGGSPPGSKILSSCRQTWTNSVLTRPSSRRELSRPNSTGIVSPSVMMTASRRSESGSKKFARPRSSIAPIAVARFARRSGGGRSIPIERSIVAVNAFAESVGNRCGRMRSVSDAMPNADVRYAGAKLLPDQLRALEAGRLGRCATGEHRAGDVDDHDHLGALAPFPGRSGRDDRLRGGERQEHRDRGDQAEIEEEARAVRRIEPELRLDARGTATAGAKREQRENRRRGRQRPRTARGRRATRLLR